MKRNLSAYSHIIFYYNKRIHRKYKALLVKPMKLICRIGFTSKSIYLGVSEWCDLWWMKLNVSKTKTMIVSRSRIMHPQSPSLTIGGPVLKESDAEGVTTH